MKAYIRIWMQKRERGIHITSSGKSIKSEDKKILVGQDKNKEMRKIEKLYNKNLVRIVGLDDLSLPR